MCHDLDCKTVGFFLKISKEIGKAWRKSLARAQRAKPHTLCEAGEKNRIFSVSPQSRSLFFSLVPDLLFDCSAYLNTQKYGLFCSLVMTSRCERSLLNQNLEPTRALCLLVLFNINFKILSFIRVKMKVNRQHLKANNCAIMRRCFSLWCYFCDKLFCGSSCLFFCFFHFLRGEGEGNFEQTRCRTGPVTFKS